MELEGDENLAAAVMDVDEGDSFAAARGQPNRQSGWDLLALARHLITQGNPSSALHAVNLYYNPIFSSLLFFHFFGFNWFLPRLDGA